MSFPWPEVSLDSLGRPSSLRKALFFCYPAQINEQLTDAVDWKKALQEALKAGRKTEFFNLVYALGQSSQCADFLAAVPDFFHVLIKAQGHWKEEWEDAVEKFENLQIIEKGHIKAELNARFLAGKIPGFFSLASACIQEKNDNVIGIVVDIWEKLDVSIPLCQEWFDYFKRFIQRTMRLHLKSSDFSRCFSLLEIKRIGVFEDETIYAYIISGSQNEKFMDALLTKVVSANAFGKPSDPEGKKFLHPIADLLKMPEIPASTYMAINAVFDWCMRFDTFLAKHYDMSIFIFFIVEIGFLNMYQKFVNFARITAQNATGSHDPLAHFYSKKHDFLLQVATQSPTPDADLIRHLIQEIQAADPNHHDHMHSRNILHHISIGIGYSHNPNKLYAIFEKNPDILQLLSCVDKDEMDSFEKKPLEYIANGERLTDPEKHLFCQLITMQTRPDADLNKESQKMRF